MQIAMISDAIEQVGQPSSTHHHAVGLGEAERSTVCLVERAQRAQVDHLGLDALAGQLGSPPRARRRRRSNS
jgi:hypothetical protein